MRKLLAAAILVCLAVAPAAAEIRTIPVCQSKTLAASDADLYGLGNGITDCTYVDITAGKYLSYQVYCTETTDDSMSIEADWYSGSAAGTAYLAVTESLESAYTTEAAWSTITNITAPLSPVGTIRFTNNNTDDDVVCSANVYLLVSPGNVDQTLSGDVDVVGSLTVTGPLTFASSHDDDVAAQTCAEYTYTGAWSCADVAGKPVFTRTASGANLTFTQTTQTIVVGQAYSVTYTIGTPFAGTFSATVGGNVGATRTTASTTTYTDHLVAGTTGKLIFTAVAASTGTISDISVEAETSGIFSDHGPVYLYKEFADATANQSAVTIISKQTGAGGNKTALRVELLGSGTGNEYPLELYADGTVLLQMNAAGSLIPGSTGQAVSFSRYFSTLANTSTAQPWMHQATLTAWGSIFKAATTVGVMNGSDTLNIFDAAITNSNHTGASNIVNAFSAGNITGDAEASEYVLNVGTGWDAPIALAEATANGSVAALFTAVSAPTGAQTAIQGWMRVDVAGTPRYIPFW